jgi:cysteine desulfurase
LRKPLEVLYRGGGQERNVRPGTENVAGAAALANCLEKHLLPDAFNNEYAKTQERWKILLSGLATIKRSRLIPHEQSIDDDRFFFFFLQEAFEGIPGEVMARALDDMGFAVSTGSACSSASPERPVLEAMGITDSESLEGIRISQGWTTTEESIHLLLSTIEKVLKFL